MEESLREHSGKLLYLLNLLRNSNGKVLIYHHDLIGTGIFTIAEMLKQNGFLTENGQ